MDKEHNQKRIKNLYTMLLEMAMGNFTFRMQLTDEADEIDNLATMLNQCAEKMVIILGKFGNTNPTLKPDSLKTSDADVIKKVLNYIKDHLEEPLPSTKELSKMFSTNEFTLKDNFRKIVHTSIYQFYNEERLKKAEKLIRQTDISLKEIAFICGFNDYTNFYKSFKKKYTYAPSAISRKQ